MDSRRRIRIGLLLGAAIAAFSPFVAAAPAIAPPNGIIGVDDAQLDPAFWIARLAHPDAVILDAGEIAARNARLEQVDPTVRDLHALPATFERKDVRDWIEALSSRPTRELFDAEGKPIEAARIDALLAALALDAIPATVPARYGLAVERAPLRTFPTTLRVFSRRGDSDIDRFQESALFPGTPVVVVHESADGGWWFVVSPRYRAWVEKKHVALGTAAQVFGYAAREPARIVTGAYVRTVMTPEQAALSELRLDMGTRIPVLADWPPAQPVNGQHPYTSWVLQLPLRGADGTLAFAPALVQRNADTRSEYLPLTRANIVRQAFKFLGERYGWGHSYDARDCSGFVSDVYRSMGVLMPRNTRDQSVSPGLDHRLFGPGDESAARIAAARALQPGDLVYIPGHVMMTIGSIEGDPYVIHDTGGIRYRRADGSIADVDLNEVSVTPLLPLLFNDTQTYVDRMTSIVRFRPAPATATQPASQP